MTKNTKKKPKTETSEPAKERECGLCGMPQAASEFSIRTTPSPNCRRCERAYNMLHFHERMTMPVVRGNIRALGGPGLLVSTYKREGVKALDVNQSFIQRRNRRSTRSDGPVDGASQSTGNGATGGGGQAPEIKADKGAAEKGKSSQAGDQEKDQNHGSTEKGTASDTGSQPKVEADHGSPAKGEASEKVDKEKPDHETKASGQDTKASAATAQPTVLHTQEELDLLGKYGGIKIIETDLGKRFVYKRKRAES